VHCHRAPLWVSSEILKDIDCSSPPRARHDPTLLSALFFCSLPIFSACPLHPFSPFTFSAVLPLTFRQSLHVLLTPLVLADVATAAVFARAPLPLVLLEAAAAAFFALTPHSLVRTMHGPCGTWWLHKARASEVRSDPIHWLLLHHALRSYGASVVPPWTLCPPVFSSCPRLRPSVRSDIARTARHHTSLV